MKALICLSGGIDSAVVLHMMMERGPCEAILFDYGQPHSIELSYANGIAASCGVASRLIKLHHMPLIDGVVFAGRNLVLASHAVSVAAAEGFDVVAMGCNQSDWERFPDCRPAFWSSLNSAIRETYGVSVVLPLLRMTKTQVVAEAFRRGVSLEATWSCYAPHGGTPCGQCLACETRVAAGA